MTKASATDKTGWSPAVRRLHWGMALLILITVPAGFIMARTYGRPDPLTARWHFWTANLHHSIGLTLLMLVVLRAVVRSRRPLPAPLGTSVERHAARAVHRLLYLLLLLVPLSGWAAISSLQASAQYPNPLWVFGLDGYGPHGFMPHIVRPVAWNDPTLWRYGTFAAAHRWLLIAGGALVFLHIAAALRHHFVLRDATLDRMLKG